MNKVYYLLFAGASTIPDFDEDNNYELLDTLPDFQYLAYYEEKEKEVTQQEGQIDFPYGFDEVKDMLLELPKYSVIKLEGHFEDGFLSPVFIVSGALGQVTKDSILFKFLNIIIRDNEKQELLAE